MRSLLGTPRTWGRWDNFNAGEEYKCHTVRDRGFLPSLVEQLNFHRERNSEAETQGRGTAMWHVGVTASSLSHASPHFTLMAK